MSWGEAGGVAMLECIQADEVRNEAAKAARIRGPTAHRPRGFVDPLGRRTRGREHYLGGPREGLFVGVDPHHVATRNRK
jgi:hypothetical protein